MAVGNITDADHVNSILLAGRADLVCLARPHLADPYWTLHAAAEQRYAGVVAETLPRRPRSAVPAESRARARRGKCDGALDGRHALITGGGTGIGAAIAAALAAEGGAP